MKETNDLSALSHVAHLAPELARTFVSIASDIALVLDADGVVLNVVLQNSSGSTPIAGDWVGKRWSETVTGETRGKVEQLLKEATVNGLSRRREVNHPSATGIDIPIAYAAVRLGERGPVLAVGRDLRAIASIQQRFVETQQQMEREYWQHRQAESRYRLLFQVATDAVMVVDAESFHVVDANRAAAQLFDLALDAIIGKSAAVGIEPSSRGAVEEMLSTARATGRPAEMRVRVLGKITTASLSATPFRSDSGMLLLVRARTIDSERDSLPSPFAELVARTPDAVVVTASSGRVLNANPAFLALCGIEHEKQITGKPLADWVGRVGSDMPSLINRVKSRGIAPQVATSLNAADGRTIDVEITATLLEDQDQECIGFTLRRNASAEPNVVIDGLAGAIKSVLARLGRDRLPQLLRESTELVERHLIAHSLTLCADDRTSAAALLGIDSAQLDLRLRRLGLLPDRPPS